LVSRSGISLLGRIALSISELANKHGLYLGRRSGRIHTAIYRRTGGRLGGHVPGMPAARILVLDHTGAKSGVRRSSPLMYHEEGGVLAVVASKGGQPTNPAWFHNLMASPDTTIQIGAVTRPVRARLATDEERVRLWPRFVEFYPGYDLFERISHRRRIPIVILEPR
jgi:deazaflavin-dependent oxidoreductase (nitroreductase family)